MKRITALFSILAIAAATTAFTSNDVATSTSYAANTGAMMGCNITFKAENKSLKNLYINFEESEVRVKELVAGPWSRLDTKCGQDEWKITSKAGVKSLTCELDLVCNIKRQYKFKLEERGENGNVILNSQYVYFPSDDGWVDAGVKTIDLGNIGRHF
jgi:hypothetical protein